MDGRTRLGVGFGFCVGAGVAVQSRINGALGARLQDGIAAAAVSFAVGLVLLGVAFGFSARLRDGLGRVRRGLAEGVLRPWQLLGGLCGALFVACQGLTVTAVGVTAFTVAAVAGQLVSSLVVDRLGLAPSGSAPVTVFRSGGAALAVGAVLLAGMDRSGGSAGVLALPESMRNAPSVLLIVLPALAGIGLAWQQAVNGRVGAVGGPFSATLVNFAIGLAALLVIETLVLVTIGGPAEFPTAPWLYLGGLIGVAFIALAAVTVRWISVLLFGLTSVAGQLTTALVLDLLIPTSVGLSPLSVLGCLLTLVAVVVAARRGDQVDEATGPRR
ncbi:DMT family transporter [Nocardia goodfellowii]|uniref:Transporter family-2 protein n=1 Tax=Nocardia goodfellowii TaxID=882446 RepID=A0ABS4Q8X1_9NOCA|nr:DMT family transporter [Nocardia goodfellowii]MBP2188129.1 transporter family-2 protein [Nocardia goodfellowii]